MKDEHSLLKVSIIGIIFYAAIPLLFGAIAFCFVMALIHGDDMKERCASKGGTYFAREGVCLPIKSITMDNQ